MIFQALLLLGFPQIFQQWCNYLKFMGQDACFLPFFSLLCTTSNFHISQWIRRHDPWLYWYYSCRLAAKLWGGRVHDEGLAITAELDDPVSLWCVHTNLSIKGTAQDVPSFAFSKLSVHDIPCCVSSFLLWVSRHLTDLFVHNTDALGPAFRNMPQLLELDIASMWWW
jgi:hypothetical protein